MEDKAIDYVFKLLITPWWYYILAIVIGLIIGLWKKLSQGILAAYVFLILVDTVLMRQPFDGIHLQQELFWSWREWTAQKNQIITNIVMFIPIGFITGREWKWRGLIVSTGLSCVIEVLQLITARGLCEFDDVLHNTIGAVVGVFMASMIYRYQFSKQRNPNDC